MGRHSKLTPAQWADIETRLVDGEKPAALAKEFGVDRAAVTRRFSQKIATVKTVANQIVAAETALKSLPIAQQIYARTLADRLRSVSEHLAGAASYGAATAHRLAGIANAQVAKVDDADPMKSQEVLQGISALTKIGNEAASVGLNLLAANRDRMKALGDEPAVDTSLPTDPAEAAGAYAQLMG